MARYSRVIAKSLANTYNLSDEFIEHVYLFAPLHDIGKIGIPDSILLKPGKLTAEEKLIMNTHVNKGIDIVKKILGDFALQHLPDSKIMLNIVRYHHEFLNGSGYPTGLTEKDIPIEARIVTVADIFDALTSKRPYKKVWTFSEAIAELHKMVDESKLDADCVAVVANSPEIDKIRLRYQDAVDLL